MQCIAVGDSGSAEGSDAIPRQPDMGRVLYNGARGRPGADVRPPRLLPAAQSRRRTGVYANLLS